MRASGRAFMRLALCVTAQVASAEAVRAPCCDGFGRFGVAPTDGVLVGSLDPDGRFARGATWAYPMASVNIAPPGDGDVSVAVRFVNWTTKQITYQRGDARRDITYSILSPGILIEPGDAAFTLEGLGHVDIVGSEPKAADALTVAYVADGRLRRREIPTNAESPVPVAEMGAPWLLVWDDISRQPVEIVFTRRPRSASLEPGADGLRISADTGRRSVVGVAFPLGRRPMPAATAALAPANAEWLQAHCDRVARLLMAFPMECDEQYELSGGDALVTDRVTRRRMLESDWDIEPLIAAPLPPMVSSGRRLGYPITVQADTTDLGIPTVWGPFEAALGQSEVTYRLPIPPLEETGYVDVVGQDRLKTEVNRCAGLEGYPEPGYNGWPLGSVSANFPSKITGNALCAWAILTPEQQQALVAANEPNMRAWAASDDPMAHWTYREEPYTGLRYPACFGGDNGVDMDWGAGLAVNGLQKYAQVFGEWGMVDRQFDFVHQALAYVEWSHDWAIMGESATDNGSSGFGCDMATAAYVGVVSAARMAKVLGRSDDLTRYAALAAKLAVPLTVRLKFDEYAWEHELHCDRHFINGFQETQLFQHNSASNAPDPWWLTCAYNGYGVHQELFDLVMHTARRETAEWAALVPQYFPHILDGDRVYQYPYPTTHNGNSGYITLHWFHARSLLGEDEPTLLDELDHNRETSGSGFYWMAPIVHAELMNRHSPIVLSEWAPAAYGSGRYDPETLQAELVFSLPEGKTAVIEAGVRSLPSTVTINGHSAEGVTLDGASAKMAGPRPARLRANYVRVPITAGESRVVLSWKPD